jgi:NTE family protein
MNTTATDLVSFLHKTQLFSCVSNKTLQEIAPQLDYVQVGEGQLLIQEGEPGDSLFLVRKGKLKIVSHDEKGEEVVLNYLDAGEGVGEISLLTGEKRTASVYATQDSELVRFSKNQFEEFKEHHPEEMHQFTQGILRRIQQAHLSTSRHQTS